MEFPGKVAMITGGAIGFGRAFGFALGQRGSRIAIVDTNIELARRTATEFADRDIEAIVIGCDVAQLSEVEGAVVDTIAAFGGVDILINNAALHFNRFGQVFSKLAHSEIRDLFDVNVMGTINCSLAVRESMSSRGGGIIVNLSSAAGHKLESAYGVSKLAVRGLTAVFAKDFADDRIRVNAISPGLVATENALVEYPEEYFQRSIDNVQLIKRLHGRHR
jgi:3-oxoacyl-[acyl-carrier protein] reductase